MEKNNAEKSMSKYIIIGVVAVAVVAIAIIGVFAIKKVTRSAGEEVVPVPEAIAETSPDAVSGADMRMAVVRMDAIQSDAKVLKNLREQKEKYENKLRDELNKRQKELEKEKAEIEKSQDVLSREALQRRILDYQNKVTQLQRDLTERAQAVEASFQKALAQIQEKHLDPLVDAIIAKKNLSLVIDGRFAKIGANIANLDITDEVIKALDKKVSNVRMETPKGF